MLAFLLGGWEIAIILLLGLLLFGTRLPKVARSLGQGVSEFKGGLKGVQDQMNEAGSGDSGNRDSGNRDSGNRDSGNRDSGNRDSGKAEE